MTTSPSAPGSDPRAMPAQWCAKLRWKTHSVDRTDPARVLRVFQDGDFYTCLWTAQCIGHDDDVVAPERCGAGRSCYEAHPLLRQRDDVRNA